MVNSRSAIEPEETGDETPPPAEEAPTSDSDAADDGGVKPDGQLIDI